MINFYLAENEADHTHPDGRIHWGSIENGEIVADHSDAAEDAVNSVGDKQYTQLYERFEQFVEDYREELFEDLSDPIAVLETLNRPPIVAGVPSKTDEDTVFWMGDLENIRADGALTDQELAEVEKYELNELGIRTQRTGGVIKNHEYPERYRTVEIGTLESAQPMGDEDVPSPENSNRKTAFTVHGIWDTANREIVEDTSGEFESVIHDMADDRFPLHDSVALARLSKPTREMTIVDDTSGESVSPAAVVSERESS